MPVLDNVHALVDPFAYPLDRAHGSVAVYDSVLSIVTDMILELFKLELSGFRAETRIDNINDWDYLDNLRLISQVEARFGIRFSTAEASNFVTIADISNGVLTRAHLCLHSCLSANLHSSTYLLPKN